MKNEETMLKYIQRTEGEWIRPTKICRILYILLQLSSLSAACVGSDGQEKQIQKACTEPSREW